MPQYIYETLVRFNMLDGALAPGLGKELQEPDKQTIVVPLQDGTKWSDGSELTADDVAFTFGLAKSSSGRVVLHRVAVRRLDRGHRPADGDLQAQERARTTPTW